MEKAPLTDEECEVAVTELIKRHCSKDDRVRLLEWLAERTTLYRAFMDLEAKAGPAFDLNAKRLRHEAGKASNIKAARGREPPTIVAAGGAKVMELG